MLQWLQNESVARVIISRFCKEITEMKLQNINLKVRSHLPKTVISVMHCQLELVKFEISLNRAQIVLALRRNIADVTRGTKSGEATSAVC